MFQHTKRILCLFLAVAMLLSLAACGGTEPSVSSEEETLSSSSSSAPEASSSSEDSTAEPSSEVVDKIAAFRDKNPEAVAWLTIPGTKIDDVVFQNTSKDGNAKYMRLDNDGNWRESGCYFADRRITMGNRNSIGKNTIVYGHNLNDDKKGGVRFAQLMNYLDLPFATEHPYIQLTTLDDELVFKVFATFYTSTAFDYIMTDFSASPTAFTDLVKEAKLCSEHNFDVDVKSSDKIITLSTCTYKYGGVKNKEQRFVVMGRLLRPGETMADKVTATKNPSPKAPSFTQKY